MSSSGLPSQAFEYIMYNPGLMSEKDYPYTAIVCKLAALPQHKPNKIMNPYLITFDSSSVSKSGWYLQVPTRKSSCLCEGCDEHHSSKWSSVSFSEINVYTEWLWVMTFFSATYQYDEMGIVDAVATRNPVSFAFEVTPDFMHYRQGVYSRWEEVTERTREHY